MEDVAPEMTFEESMKVSKIKYAVSWNMWYEHPSWGETISKASSNEAKESIACSEVSSHSVDLGHGKTGESGGKSIVSISQFLPRI